MPPSASSAQAGSAIQAAGDSRVDERGTSWKSALGLLRFAYLVNRRRFVLTVALSLLGSIAEGAALVILLPLLAAAGMNFPGQTLPGRVAAFSQGILRTLGLPHALWLPAVLAVFLAVGATRSILRRVQSTLTYTTTNTAELALSRRVYAAVVRAQWAYLVRQRAGRLTHVLTEQQYRVTEAIALLLSILNMLGLTALYLLLALRLSASMTVLVLALGLGLLILQRRPVRRSRSAGFALNESIGEVFAATEEHLLNLKSVKTYDAEERDVEHFATLCDRVVRNSVESAKHQAAAGFHFELGSLVALGSLVFVALGPLHVQAATLILLLGIFTRLMPQLGALQSQAHQFALALPAYDRVLELERECLAHAEAQLEETHELPPLTRTLGMEDVSFTYQSSTSHADALTYVLRNVTFSINAGTLTAIAGPSGAGKSTVADILNGLLVPTRGCVMVDDQGLSPAQLRGWRRQVGYVGQETVLFHQTIRENLLWARPQASDAELEDALGLAAAEFVHQLPHGLDTLAGDRGVLLSSGQRQRIALARALLRRPSLLILDEATNALDVENEDRILDALRQAIARMQGSLTVLMIAHRPTALARADRVLYIDRGRIASAAQEGRGAAR